MTVSEERVIHRDPHRYIAHPHLAALSDGSLLLIATCGPRRGVTLHPPLDPEFITIGLRSTDEGETWSAPAPVPTYGHTGTECGGLTALPDGSVLLNQWRFRWHGDGDTPPEPVTPAAALRTHLRDSTELDGADHAIISWQRGGGSTTIWRGTDGGRHWSDPFTLDCSPWSGGYGLRGGVTFPDGEIVVPLCDVPDYARIFLVRSHDGGRTWLAAEPVAAAPGRAFEEPAPVAFPDGRLTLLLRENSTGHLNAVHSPDRGRTWSAPEPAGIPGYPAHIVHLQHARIAAVTATRRPAGTIHLTLSADAGRTWGTPIAIAGPFDTHDLGYPTAAVTRADKLFVAYYRRDREGVTALYGRHVRH